MSNRARNPGDSLADDPQRGRTSREGLVDSEIERDPNRAAEPGGRMAPVGADSEGNRRTGQGSNDDWGTNDPEANLFEPGKEAME